MLLTSDTCPSCPAALAWFSEVGGPVEALGPIVPVEIRDLPDEFLHRYGLRGTPDLVIFRDGRVVDFVPVAARDQVRWLYHVMGRIDRTRPEPFYLSDLTGLRPDRRAWGPEVIPGTTQIGHNWGDLTATDLDLRASVYSGNGFAGADFSRSDLTDVVFAGCDLTGAHFDGAKLDNVVWLATICPDGTPSAAAGDSCRGHLAAGGSGDEPQSEADSEARMR